MKKTLLSLTQSLLGASIPVLCYHQVRPESGMTPQKFGSHLDLIRRMGFETINLARPGFETNFSSTPTRFPKTLSLAPELEYRTAMNIAFVNSTRKWGGVKTWILDFSKEMNRLGHEVTIFGRPSVFIDACADVGIRAHGTSFGFDYNPSTIFFFLYQFLQNNTDVLFTNISKDIRTAGIAARLLKIPVIRMVGNPEDIALTSKEKILHSWIRPKYLCSCEYIRDGLLDRHSYIKLEDTHVILTGKHIPKNHPSEPHSPRQLIMTSRLSPEKGHAALLRCLKKIKDKGLPFHVHILGSGILESELKNLASDMNLNDRITWHGFQNDVTPYLHNADIYIHPATNEGLPNSLQEAMAFGLIPVASDIGGMKEVWPFELKNLLLSVEDLEAQLTNTIDYLLQSNPKDFYEYKIVAKNMALKTFELNKLALDFERWTMDIIKSKQY
jgi:glycosyltransferase involved in cell wall biosynthesis